jgi:hypothetical protein
VPLRIAFDLDGVLADMESELIRHAAALFGPDVLHQPVQVQAVAPDAGESGLGAEPSAAPPLTRLKLTPRQQRRLWRHIETIENFWESLSEIEPGSVARLSALATRRRWETIFLTRRPPSAGATAQVQSQRWLEAKGFPMPSVFVAQGSRGRIAAALALDFVVDDRPENCLDVAIDSRARAILVTRAAERELPPASERLGSIGVVSSVSECLDILGQIDAPGRDKPGLWSRVLRLLGVKESAGV